MWIILINSTHWLLIVHISHIYGFLSSWLGNRSSAPTTQLEKQILNDVYLHLLTWNWGSPSNPHVCLSISTTAHKSAATGRLLIWAQPYSSLNSNSRINRVIFKRNLLDGNCLFPVLDQNTDVPEALSASHPNIPAGRPSEKSRRGKQTHK